MSGVLFCRLLLLRPLIGLLLRIPLLCLLLRRILSLILIILLCLILCRRLLLRLRRCLILLIVFFFFFFFDVPLQPPCSLWFRSDLAVYCCFPRRGIISSGDVLNMYGLIGASLHK